MAEKTIKPEENDPRVLEEDRVPGQKMDYRLSLTPEQRRRQAKEGVRVPEGKSWDSFYDDH